MGVLLGSSPGVSTGREEKTPVIMAPGDTPVASVGNSNGVRGRL